mgnify:CR=1 FL=1
MSITTEKQAKVNRVNNIDLSKAGVSASELTAKVNEITNPTSELEILKQKLAIAEAALIKATTKQKAFSSVSYLFTLLPDYINKEGLLPILDKETALILQAKVLAKQKEIGVEKEYKLVSVNTDYRFFSMSLSAIHERFYLNVRTKPAEVIKTE